MTVRGRKPKGSAHIAGEDEVLECLTSVLRGTDAEEMKITPRDRLRAAELLAKRYGTLGAAEPQAEAPRIIDDIPASADEDD
ncbi:MAG TPA: hypothetical protein P5559_00815 [Candidatus Limiplasma sp.]|nr:hypothetical protein [Candidatus Limiplasma sp.]